MQTGIAASNRAIRMIPESVRREADLADPVLGLPKNLDPA
jgi:hypothetical protein